MVKRVIQFLIPLNPVIAKAKKKKKKSRKKMTRLQFFEQQMSLNPKGFYRVWMGDFNLYTGEKVRMFLHAVNDSKPVYRISKKHAGLPMMKLEITGKDQSTRNKVKRTVMTSSAH